MKCTSLRVQFGAGSRVTCKGVEGPNDSSAEDYMSKCSNCNGSEQPRCLMASEQESRNLFVKRVGVNVSVEITIF